MDFSFFYRDELELNNDINWDLFLSSFNNSDRVRDVFRDITATSKFWLIQPEYDFLTAEIPNSNVIVVKGKNELEQLQSLDSSLNLSQYIDQRVCIDITGFMRPQLILLLRYLENENFKSVDFIYSEPSIYKSKEKTEFSSGSVYETRQITGFQGSNNANDKRDLIIILAGYDKNLIGRAVQYSENADVVMLFGFPSLQPDMYQENILCTVEAYDSMGEKPKDPLFAPAWDPFETASALINYIDDNKCLRKYRHVYICPLSTKPQALGAGLAWMSRYENEAVSLIYPFTKNYQKETSTGVAKTWLYTVEFDNL